ncbi:MAG: helix-turn-helix domain-containing protein, partial [Ferruginibacter sp.]
EHLIERSVLLSTNDYIEISIPLHKHDEVKNGEDELTIKKIDDHERDYILKILKHVDGRISGEGGAADLLGIPPSTLNSKIKKLGIRKEHFG